MDDPPPDYLGHRSRLRERVLADSDAVQDYELLEYLLMMAIPRIDTKPIAKALLKEFGGIGAVLSADPTELKRVKGMGDASAAAIKAAHAAGLRMARRAIAARPMLSNWQALLDYLRADMSHQPIERVRVLYLDTRNQLIRDELMWEGSVDSAQVHVREVIARALLLKASGLILAHNHPSGDPSPSRADITLTREVIAAGKVHDIAVHDHLVIGANSYKSLRAEGLI